MIEIKFKKLVPEAVIPTKATEHAACFDLVCTRIEMKGENKAIIYFGLACEIPIGYKMDLQPRSSFTLKDWVMTNSPGKIDCDYRGELQMRIQAFPTGVERKVTVVDNIVHESFHLVYPKLPFEVGDRTIQAEINPVTPVKLWEASELSDTIRGTGGFGSTGKK